MKIRIFVELPEFPDMTLAKRLKVGDKFLTGTQVIGQKDNKKVGDTVTYYEITYSDKKGNISYKIVYEKLEE